jgi:D-glutamate N-acetyltransferase
MRAPRSWLVLTDGYLITREAKTAHGVIRYSPDDVACVLDRGYAGQNVAQILPDLTRDAPVVASMNEALQFHPTSLLLGVATPGGWIPDHWRTWVIEAIEAGLEIVNGLHGFLADDPQLAALANEHGARLWDVRQPPSDIPLCSGKAIDIPQRTLLTVGSDCAVGKMTVSLELAAAGKAAGVKTEFVATGQTGILIAGGGIAVDRVISDFLAGAAEKLVLQSASSSEVLIVEGQGGLWHPAYAAVTLGLLYGCAPEVLVMCHQAGRRAIEEPPFTTLPALPEMIATYEGMAATVRRAKVACVAINCRGLSGEQARRVVEEAEDETGLPAGDVWAGDAPKLWTAVASALAAREVSPTKK